MTAEQLNQRLLEACNQGSPTEGIRNLVQQGARAGAVDPVGNSALHAVVLSKATEEVKVELLELLITQGGGNVNHVRASDGVSVLLAAAGSGCGVPVLALLIKHGAEMHHKDSKGWNLMHHAISGVFPTQVPSEDDPEVAINVWPVDVLEFVDEQGVNIHHEDELGCNAFHRAVLKCCEEPVLQYLKKREVDIKCVDKNGWNVIHNAIQSGCGLNIHKYLVENGGNPYHIDTYGYNILHRVVANHCEREIVEYFCSLEPKINLEHRDTYGYTVLHRAISNNNKLDVVQTLVRHGAKVLAKTSDDSSVLVLVKQFAMERPAVFQFLHEATLQAESIGDNGNFAEGIFEITEEAVKVERKYVNVNVPNSSAPHKIYYRINDIIGRGSFGTVYKAYDATTGATLAVKEVLIGNAVRKNQVTREQKILKREITALQMLCHPNIVGYYGMGEILNELGYAICLEFVGGGSIYHAYLRRYGPVEPALLTCYLGDVLQGLAYIHSNRIAHMDLKGANVLLTSGDRYGARAKITDFGSCKVFHAVTSSSRSSRTCNHGTVEWMAPECLSKTKVNGQLSDIWSVGCFVIEMVTASTPWSRIPFFKGDSTTTPPSQPPKYDALETYDRIVDSTEIPEMPHTLSANAVAVDFLNRCFLRDPELRWTAEQLLHHPWITNSQNQ